MYKERYDQALRSGDQQRIQAAGREYYRNLLSKPDDDAIETAILQDVQALNSVGQ